MRPYLNAPHPALVETMRSIRQDARSEPKPTEAARPFLISFTFDGDGVLPTPGDSLTQPLGKLTARIVGCTIVADAVVTDARIDLQVGHMVSWPTTAPISPVVLEMTNAAAVRIPVTGWITDLQPDDILAASLVTATGTFTSVTLTLECIHIKWPSTIAVTGSSSSSMVTSSGTRLIFRP
jgi:hypothetical protein